MKQYEKYKDSGIEWIGNIPEHWTCDKFKHNVRLITTKATDTTTPKIAFRKY